MLMRASSVSCDQCPLLNLALLVVGSSVVGRFVVRCIFNFLDFGGADANVHLLEFRFIRGSADANR